MHEGQGHMHDCHIGVFLIHRFLGVFETPRNDDDPALALACFLAFASCFLNLIMSFSSRFSFEDSELLGAGAFIPKRIRFTISSCSCSSLLSMSSSVSVSVPVLSFFLFGGASSVSDTSSGRCSASKYSPSESSSESSNVFSSFSSFSIPFLSPYNSGVTS